MNTLILFDLEETLIESFSEPFFIMPNVHKIVDFIKTLEPNTFQFGLMSWAIWDWSASECKIFDDVKSALLHELDTSDDLIDTGKFNDEFTLSMDNWVSVFWKESRIRIDREEIPHIFNKEDFLFKCRTAFTGINRVILIDDTVEHGLTIKNKNGTIEFLNIKEM